MSYDPDRVARSQTSVAWSAFTRAGIDLDSALTWDRDLLREPRVLVPIDVQAYVAPAAGNTEPALRFPSPLSPGAPAGIAAVQGPPPFDPGALRPAGVHLHWALPDALLRGTLRDPRAPIPADAAALTAPTASGGGLGLPALPDRWVVLRLAAAQDGSRVAVRGWVLDAATATAWDLGSYPSGSPLPPRPGEGRAPVVPREGLTGTAGGSLTWTGGYDAAFGRFAWHDPLDDLSRDPALAGALPGGPAAGKATYLVAGWWSDPELDPLDGIRTEGGLAERLEALGWRLLPGGGTEAAEREGAAARSATVGLEFGHRWKGVAGGKLEPASAAAPFGRSVAGAVSELATEASAVVPGRPIGEEASTLLHGAVVGIPVDGTAGGTDLRPQAAGTRLALGDSLDELVATLAASALGSTTGERATLERLLWAFNARLLARLGSPDGLADLDEARHAASFTSVDPNEPPETDRVLTGRAAIPPRTRRTGAPPSKAGKVTLHFGDRKARGLLIAESKVETAAQNPKSTAARPAGSVPAPPARPGEETIERPAPSRYVPIDPVLAVTGAGRNLRHGGDGRWSVDGRLGVRRPSHVAQDYSGLLRGADILPSLGSGAVPAEMVLLAREAILLSPHLIAWLGRASAERSPHLPRPSVEIRVAAEMALRYDDAGAYTAAAGFAASSKPQPAAGLPSAASPYMRLAAELARRHSLLAGIEPDPVGITSWAQPWVPLWIEYELAVRRAPAPDELSGWRLGAVDGELSDPTSSPRTPDQIAVIGRVPLTTGPADSVAGSLARYVADEDERDRQRTGEVDDEVRNALQALGRAAGSLDLLGAALDGVRAALRGIPGSSLRARNASGQIERPVPSDLPRLVAAGTISLVRTRLVDAFGRFLDLDPSGTAVPVRAAADAAATIRRAPRLSAPARVRLRLVGSAAASAESAVPARVDEIDPAAQVNPVAGFLLPDHVDESIEVFGRDGTPLGELLVEPVGGGVIWEPAPGRPLPHDAPPAAGLTPEQAVLARFASGLVAADAQERRGRAAAGAVAPESALSAFLRAVDTTLWTIDPIAGAGTSAVGGIVGRPVAVVAATLLLDVADDLADLELDEAGRAARETAYRDLVRLEFPVRLGELTRTDDGLLGYFLDGDFTRFHLVDRAVADLAREAGRGRGHLTTWGETPDMPAIDPIRHPYLHPDDEVRLRPGVPRLLTLLMMPGAAVHVTSGIVPRQKVRLARAWFAAGLERLSPSVRVGPVLIDPGGVRLPLVAALGDRQTLTTREGPLGWRDDPILAATQSAVLPDRTSTLREGWIRVTPESVDETGPDGTGGTP